MKQEAIDLVFLIDQSGSMAGLEDDTIGGFNTLLKQQQAIAGEAYVTTVLFDDRYERIHDHTEIRLVPPLTSQDYTPCGSTALLDAIGRTIRHIEMEQRKRGRNQREKVLFFIITDGQENASRHYTFPMIRSQIERQKEKYGWEFLFFGANMDAIAEAEKFGINADRAQNYRGDSFGTSSVYRTISAVSTGFRTGKGFPGMEVHKSEQAKTPEEAKAKLGQALRELKQAMEDLAEELNQMRDVAAANNGEIPDVNKLYEQVLEENQGDDKE